MVDVTDLEGTSSTVSRPKHRSVVSYAESLAYRELDASEEVSSYDALSVRDVMSVVIGALNRQTQVNEANSQLHSMNFLLNYANASRSQRLQRQYDLVKRDIREGQVVLAKMQTDMQMQASAIASLADNVNTVASGVERHEGMLEQLSGTLEEQREQVTRTLEQYHARLKEQEDRLRSHEQTLERMLSVRFRVDFGVDMVILLLSWWLSASRLLRFLASTSAGLVIPRTRHRMRQVLALTSAVRLFAFASLVHTMRRRAAHAGLHNMVGSYRRYAHLAVETVRHRVPLPAPLASLPSAAHFLPSQLPLPLSLPSAVARFLGMDTALAEQPQQQEPEQATQPRQPAPSTPLPAPMRTPASTPTPKKSGGWLRSSSSDDEAKPFLVAVPSPSHPAIRTSPGR